MCVYMTDCVRSTGVSARARDLPPYDLLPAVHRGLRLVCPLARQKVLYEAVQPVRVDPRGAADCGDSELSDHTEHLRGHDLVRRQLIVCHVSMG